jgi:hypothetical protein
MSKYQSTLISTHQEEFARLNPSFSQPNPFVTEKTWLKTADKSIYVALLLDKVDKDWSLVVAGRTSDGKYQVLTCAVSHPTEDDAFKAAQNIVHMAWRQGGIPVYTPSEAN